MSSSSVARKQPGDAKTQRPGEMITGEAAEAISAQRAALTRRPDHTQHVREMLGLPPEWRWVMMHREGDHPDYWGTTLEGGICPPKTRGKYKGRPNWAKATLKRKFTLTDVQHTAWLRQWEADEGRCHGCEGTGFAWAGWHHERGTEYRTCRRCNGTGKPPSPADTSGPAAGSVSHREEPK